MDYAKKFKDTCENSSINEASSVYFEWVRSGSGKDDANFYLASAIVYGAIAITKVDKDAFNLMKASYEEATNKKPSDYSLYDWYNETAAKVVINFAKVKK